LALVGASLLLTALPWLPPLRKMPPAEVHLDNCNGCARCFADCPFGAITMVARSDGAAFEQEARVAAELCVSCGICVGACPTATPFRRATALVPGIELPTDPIADLRARVVAVTAPLRGDARTLIVACAHAGDSGTLTDPGVGVISVPCVGMLPPSFIDFALSRRHADGVLIAGCATEDCYERLGQRWTEARIANQRDPHLRDRVSRDRVAVSWDSPAQLRQVQRSLAQFRGHLRSLAKSDVIVSGGPAWQPSRRRLPTPLRVAGQLLVLVSLAVLIGWFATRPTYAQFGRDEALIKLSFSHAAQPLKPCRRYSPDELARLPFDERRATTCERGRWPVYLELDLDGRTVHRGTHSPAGLWNDGPSTLYARFPVPAGRHRLDARLRDSGRGTGFDYTGSATATLTPGQNFVIDFHGAEGGFRFGQPLPTTPAARGTER
jgi:ferredoxin/coenzyme F420-reducing hydrogenase delta subunit